MKVLWIHIFGYMIGWKVCESTEVGKDYDNFGDFSNLSNHSIEAECVVITTGCFDEHEVREMLLPHLRKVIAKLPVVWR
ncbi:MAG: hypothetical protein ACTSUO_00135 [Candidatus Thorarchaeota archaeon]